MGSNGPAGSALERRTVSPRSSLYLYPSASDLPRGEIRWFLCCVPDLAIIVILVSLLVRHLLGGCGTDRAPSLVSLAPRMRQHWCTVRRSCSRMQKIVRAGEPQFPSVCICPQGFLVSSISRLSRPPSSSIPTRRLESRRAGGVRRREGMLPG